MPVAVALGGDPAYAYSATAPLPENVDEYMLAGFLRKKKVELVKCITQPDIEVPADPFAVDGVEVLHGLLGGDDKLVPDVLDGDFYAEVLCHRNRFFDFCDRAIEALLVSRALAHVARHQQHTRRAVGVCVVQTVHKPVEAEFTRRFIRRGEWLHPVDMIANACGLQASFLCPFACDGG